MILKLSKDKKLTFYRKNPIYIGEKDFNTIEVLISPTIDGNETNELNFILHLVNKDGEYLHIDLDKEIKEDIIVGSTQITTNITSVAQKFSVYIEMVRGNDEIIGKTNVLEIEVNPLPDEQGEIIPEEIERRSTIISQDNPPENSHKKYKLNALWINYTDKTQFVLTSINESQAPEKYVYTWERNNNHVVVSTEVAPEYTPDNVDYKYSNGDVWVQINSDSDKIISISVCTGYTKELINDETWRYDYTWAILNSGVTSYNDLTDKPSINDISLEGNKSARDLGLQRIIENYFTVENNEYLEYNFNSISISLLSPNSVMYCVPFSRVRNFPNSLSDKIRQSGTLYIFHYVHTVVGAKYLIRRIMGRSPSGNYVEFAQYCTIVDSGGSVIEQSDWVELSGGGSQIVSAVVNANGTITFTDSDGNTFTTTGSSVIGADGIGIADVHIDGGGDLIIKYTTGHMENVGHVVGADGQDYVLTAQDKSDIADIVLSELPTTQGVLYGN